MPRPRDHVDPVIEGADRILAAPRRRDGRRKRRCAEPGCGCFLAADNPTDVCRPCQARLNGTPRAVHDFLEGRP